MRTSLLSRSVVAVATLGIGSVALAAVPASADTPSGITRDQVLTAAAGVRAAPTTTSTQFGLTYGAAANRAIRAIVNRTCGADPDGPELFAGSIAAATAGGGSADGIVVTAIFQNLDSITGTPGSPDYSATARVCSFGALATTGPRSVLTGSTNLSDAPTFALSGDVFVTPVSNRTYNVLTSPDPSVLFPTFSASGTAIQSNPTKVSTPKTTKQKKSAKKKYDKARDKAGNSKSKRARAKKAYSKSKASAKAKYRKAVATYKIVTYTVPTPFSVSAQFVIPVPPAPTEE